MASTSIGHGQAVEEEEEEEIVEISSEKTSEHELPAKTEKFRSEVWKHFDQKMQKSAKGEMVKIAKCKYCSKGSYLLDAKNKGSTGNMNTHLIKNHKAKLSLPEKPEITPPKQTNQKEMNEFLCLENQEIFRKTFREKMVAWVVLQDQSHTEVESDAFREMIHAANKNLVVVSADTVKNDIMKAYEKEKKRIVETFKKIPGKLSISFDGWTAPNILAFFAFRGHWISVGMKVEELLISFCEFKGRHTGADICSTFLKILSEFDIDVAKIMSFTTDNASNNDTFITEFRKAVEAKGYQFDEKKGRVRRYAHVMNLAVQKFLDELKVVPNNEAEDYKDVDDVEVSLSDQIRNIMNRLRKLVKKVRCSPQNRNKLEQACKFQNMTPILPIIDVKTRWNSSFNMIKAAVSLKPALAALCTTEPDLAELFLNEAEWKIIVTIQLILGKFKRATQHVSMSRHTTISSLVPMNDWLREYLQEFINKNSGTVGNAAKMALAKLVEYAPNPSHNPIMYVSVVLNPTLKLNYFKEHKYDNRTIKAIKELSISIFDETYSHVEPASDENDDEDNDNLVFLAHLHKRSRKDKKESEIQKYLGSSLAAADTDVISWWSAHQPEFPLLSKMAMDYLAVPSTSVSTEREFSSGVDLITPTRNRLSGSTISASMCLKSWWKSSNC